MKQLWSVLFGAVTMATLGISSTFADVTIMGEGLNSCGSWVVAERNDAYFGLKVQWVLGFLSGMNLRAKIDGVPTTSDAIKQVGDGDAVQVWMDNYCKAHPTEKIGEAATTLMYELEHRQAK
jgi:hypothetical protein